MPRRFVNQLADQEALDQIFLASEKQLRPNRNGNLYLQVQLSDRSGAISARLWNATDEQFRNFENGDYVRVIGNTQVYQGGLQIIASKIAKAQGQEIDPSVFRRLSSDDVGTLFESLCEMLATIQEDVLQTLCTVFLEDEVLVQKLRRAPAGVKLHHAHEGGLLEHVVSLMALADRVASCYPQLNRDLLLVGVLLHDIGKLDELAYERDFHYTDAGQLLGHVVLGLQMLESKLAVAEARLGKPFPSDLALQLKHLIVSHHGHYEFGSPKLPMTLEALTLHSLDHLDAKLAEFGQIMRDDLNLEGRWTPYQAQLGRKLYKTTASFPAATSQAGGAMGSESMTPAGVNNGSNSVDAASANGHSSSRG